MFEFDLCIFIEFLIHAITDFLIRIIPEFRYFFLFDLCRTSADLLVRIIADEIAEFGIVAEPLLNLRIAVELLFGIVAEFLFGIAIEEIVEMLDYLGRNMSTTRTSTASAPRRA